MNNGDTEASVEVGSRTAVDKWVRRGCALLVAGVAAYASYQHQHVFAVRGGADSTTARLWPLSVDGLLTLATAGLLRAGRDAVRRSRRTMTLTFVLCIAVSLAANIATAPTLTWQPVLVAGWPPVALLLAVELVAYQPRQRERVGEVETAVEASISSPENENHVVLVRSREDETAEQIMWSHYRRERSAGRSPSGAELDRVAGTNNYGRAVLRRWRDDGRLDVRLGGEPADGSSHRTEQVGTG